MKFISKIINRIKFYYLKLRWCYILRSSKICNLIPQRQFARRVLENYSPNPGGSHCIVDSIIKKSVPNLLSIIVPAYNAEKTIEACLKSVLDSAAEFQYELIVINDGSTDKTKEIVQGLSTVRSEIVLVNQRNKGFSGARNTGILNAAGEYIVFLDSDDVMCPNAVDTLMKSIVNSDYDIVEGGYYRFCETRKTVIHNADKEIDAFSLRGQPWGKIYRAELFNNVRFPEGYWYEDTLLAFLIYPFCKKVKSINNIVYGYRENPYGITVKGRLSSKCIDTYWVVEEMINALDLAGKQITQKTYDQVIIQFGRLMYTRTYEIPEPVKKALFANMCYFLEDRFNGYTTSLSGYWLGVEMGIRNGDYLLWKKACFLLCYE